MESSMLLIPPPEILWGSLRMEVAPCSEFWFGPRSFFEPMGLETPMPSTLRHPLEIRWMEGLDRFLLVWSARRRSLEGQQEPAPRLSRQRWLPGQVTPARPPAR